MTLKNSIAIIFIVIFAGTLYGLTLHGVAGNPQETTIKATLETAPNPFELSPERGRFAHIMSLVDDHSFALDQKLADFVYPDVGYYNGKFYSYFAPGLPYMAAPFYELGEHYNMSQIFTFGFISIIAILSLIFIYKIARDILKLPVWASLAAVIIFAFGSTSWSYAITLYQHLVTTFFITSGFYSVWKYKQGGWFSWVAAAYVWLAYALAISIDYPNAILVAPVGVYFFLSSFEFTKVGERVKVGFRSAFVVTALVFIAINGLHAYHNAKNFGSWHSLSGGLVGYQTLIENHLVGKNTAEVNDQIAKLGAEKQGGVVAFFSENHVPQSFATITVSTDRGIFFYVPLFLLALLGIYVASKKWDMEKGILVGLVAVNVFLYSSWGDPWGGWAYGTRYLIPSMAILSLFVAVWMATGARLWLKKLVATVLFLYSSAIAVIGAVTTNAVPPKAEAIQLHTQANFVRNWKLFLSQGKSGSYFFNHYVAPHGISLIDFAVAIYALVIIVFLFVVFILPLLMTEPHD